MTSHLPHPVRSHSIAFARLTRRRKPESPAREEADRVKTAKRSKVKRSAAPSRAFDALYSLTPPLVPAIAAPDSD